MLASTKTLCQLCKHMHIMLNKFLLPKEWTANNARHGDEV